VEKGGIGFTEKKFLAPVESKKTFNPNYIFGHGRFYMYIKEA